MVGSFGCVSLSCFSCGFVYLTVLVILLEKVPSRLASYPSMGFGSAGRGRPWATGRRASLYIDGIWIHQPKELNMKLLLCLLLVVGMVGCGPMTDQEYYYLLSDIGGYSFYLIIPFLIWRMIRKKKLDPTDVFDPTDV